MNSEEVLRDIEVQITKLIAELLDKHGSEASLCIPAVLLKTTLQISQHTLPNDDEVRDVINMSLESLKDLPPLIPKTTLH